MRQQPGSAEFSERRPWNRSCSDVSPSQGRGLAGSTTSGTPRRGAPGAASSPRQPPLPCSITACLWGPLGYAPRAALRSRSSGQGVPGHIDVFLMRLSPRNGPKTQAWSITSVGDLPVPSRGLKLPDCPVGPPAKAFSLLWCPSDPGLQLPCQLGLESARPTPR